MKNLRIHDRIQEWMGKNLSTKLVLFVLCIHLGRPLAGQYSVQLIVTDSSQKEEIYIAGNFNDWQAGNPQYRLETLDSIHKTIILQKLAPMRYSFKFTRSTWGTVEVSDYGMDMDNRSMDVKGDTLIHVVIKGWVDDFVDFNKIPDSLKIEMGRYKSYFFKDKNLDSCLKYAILTYEASHQSGDKISEIISMIILGDVYQRLGKMDKALDLFLSALQAAEAVKDPSLMSDINEYLGNIYKYHGDDLRAKQYFREALSLCPSGHLSGLREWSILDNLSRIFFETFQFDSAEFYAHAAIKTGLQFGGPMLVLGDLNRMAGRFREAMDHYRIAVTAGNTHNNLKDVGDAYQRIGQIFKDYNRTDSSFYYLRKAYALALEIKNPFSIVAAGSLMVDLFSESNQFDSAFIYQQRVLIARDSLYNLEKTKQIQSLAFNDQLRRQDIKLARQQFQNKIRMYGLLGVLSIFLIIVFMLWRNNRQRQQAYTVLQKQKQETDTQKSFAEQMLDKLQTTQKQLIQSEKMASLGELTSGIAHEIKNPLNFINNFSEINLELIGEIEQDYLTGPENEQSNGLPQSVKYLKKNSEKINHHGKRIDEIVKGMLQHSRMGDVSKEMVNINALCEEALKLAYHGFRAKEKGFQVSVETRLDAGMQRMLAIPQEMSRVLLNLINNALYAVHLKKRMSQEGVLTDTLQVETLYIPSVIVSTQYLGNKISIKISDNGMGIREDIIGKIFQPFFTTKPTGEGTGLGLSMAYDIITKGHGGELKVKSKEYIGSDFEIILPAAATPSPSSPSSTTIT